jgi:hypothetical protein
MVGPEAPLVAGLADDLAAAGIRAFGPSAAAAQLEGSKKFMKVGDSREQQPQQLPCNQEQTCRRGCSRPLGWCCTHLACVLCMTGCADGKVCDPSICHILLRLLHPPNNLHRMCARSTTYPQLPTKCSPMPQQPRSTSTRWVSKGLHVQGCTSATKGLGHVIAGYGVTARPGCPAPAACNWT